MTEQRVAILLATYRRPDLLFQTLRSLGEMTTVHSFDVIVVDNDAAGASAREVTERAGEFTYTLKAVCEPRAGIAAARNRGLDESTEYDIVCFIDDDEQVDHDWLDRILAPLADSTIDAVSGPVDSRFAQPIPAWAHLGGFFLTPDTVEGSAVHEAATNNLAIRRAALDASPAPRFDERFSESGGSDIFLSSQFSASGRRIVWTNRARVSETVPAQRCTPEWIRGRAIRGGNTHARVALLRPDCGPGGPASLTRRCAVITRGLTRIVFGSVLVVTAPRISRSARGARGYRILLRGIGYARAPLGSAVLEYKRR